MSLPAGNGLRPPVLITTTENKYGTAVEILGPVKVPEFQTMVFGSPPMIAVDIFRRVPSFKSVIMPLKNRYIKDIRLGYHPEKIRVVLDIQGDHIPPFSTESINNKLSIFLRSAEWGDLKMSSEEDTQVVKTGIQKESFEVKQQPISSDAEIPSSGKLLGIGRNDDQEDTALLLKSIQAYRRQDWSGAVDGLQDLLTLYPTGTHAERAHFLLAKAYSQLQSDDLLPHFEKVIAKYREAVQKFPQSTYVPDALLSMGDMYYRIDNTYEARGYYNLVLKKEKDSKLALKASIGLAKIMAHRKNRKEAVSLLKKAIDEHQDSPEQREAKFEMAKILYEMNYFLKSLEILSNLKSTNPDNIYRYPEISLYMGYNYHQLGENMKARENLLRYYNSRPDKESSHLILTKIGDNYREEGAIKEAVEFYNLVITQHPETEGAVISRIRLAEIKEDGTLGEESKLSSATNILGKEQGSAREIYEKILDQPFEQDQKKSLEQLTIFKLAILEQNEGNYTKSLKTLRTLLKRFPNTSLKKDSTEAMRKSIMALMDEEIKEERFAKIIRLYEMEKDAFSIVNDPELFLKVARASLPLNLHEMALEMFKKADSLWSNEKKPPDMLFYLARDMVEGEELAQALSNVDLLIKNYPSDSNIPDAYQLKGRIFYKQKKMEKAQEMFSWAARFPLNPCKKAGVLVDKGKALIGGGFRKKALNEIKEIERLIANCDSSHTRLSREAGELFVSLGYPQKALSILKKALSVEKNKEEIILIQLKIAECYWLLDKKEDSLALYDQLASLEDPFWSNLAKERREDLHFKTEMEINQ